MSDDTSKQWSATTLLLLNRGHPVKSRWVAADHRLNVSLLLERSDRSEVMKEWGERQGEGSIYWAHHQQFSSIIGWCKVSFRLKQKNLSTLIIFYHPTHKYVGPQGATLGIAFYVIAYAPWVWKRTPTTTRHTISDLTMQKSFNPILSRCGGFGLLLY